MDPRGTHPRGLKAASLAVLLAGGLVAGCATRSRVVDEARPAETAEAARPPEEESQREEIRRLVAETRRMEEDLERVEVADQLAFLADETPPLPEEEPEASDVPEEPPP